MTFDPERLAIALRHARRVEAVHVDDLGRFLDFLHALAQSVDS